MEILNLSLINCIIKLDFRGEGNYIITEISRTFREVDPIADPAVYEWKSQATSEKFQINNAKLYVLVVTLSSNDDTKILENIKQGFKRKISCNKYRSEITKQPKNNDFNYLIDPTFTKINRLFLLSLKNDDNDPTRHFNSLTDINHF